MQMLQLPATTQNTVSEEKKFIFAKDFKKIDAKRSSKHSNLILQTQS